MSGLIPDEIVERVRDSFDIVDFISGYVPLKKAGQNYRGLCPFHQEKSPSFNVNPARQIFHCFGCGAGGNIFRFLERVEGISFPEAVRELAAKAGISIPEERRGSRNPEAEEEKEALVRINAEALVFYHQLLMHDPRAEAARAYLTKRKVDRALWDEFSLGYALPAWDALLRHLTEKGFTPRQVERAGLAIAKKDGAGHYDRFRGRVLFPIKGVGGRVVAFGGRIIDAEATPEQPKYLNSPETPVYTKGDNLYALGVAKEHIRRQGYALLVEGYMDALMCHQFGVKNAVATLGTALTPSQLRLLGRFAKKVAFLYDADPAGLNAMTRSLDLFIEAGIRANIVILPQGDDPDSFLLREGAPGLAPLLKNSVRLAEYSLGEILKRGKAGSDDDRLASIEEALRLLAKIPSAIERAELVGKVAAETGVDEALLKEELHRKTRSGTSIAKPKERIKPAASASSKAEDTLVHLMLVDRDACRRALAEISPADFRDPVLARIVALLAESDGCGDVTELVREENGDEVNRRLTSLAVQDFGIEAKEQTLSDSVSQLRRNSIDRELKGLQEEIQKAEAAGDHESVLEFIRMQDRLRKERKR